MERKREERQCVREREREKYIETETLQTEGHNIT